MRKNNNPNKNRHSKGPSVADSFPFSHGMVPLTVIKCPPKENPDLTSLSLLTPPSLEPKRFSSNTVFNFNDINFVSEKDKEVSSNKILGKLTLPKIILEIFKNNTMKKLVDFISQHLAQTIDSINKNTILFGNDDPLKIKNACNELKNKLTDFYHASELILSKIRNIGYTENVKDLLRKKGQCISGYDRSLDGDMSAWIKDESKGIRLYKSIRNIGIYMAQLCAYEMNDQDIIYGLFNTRNNIFRIDALMAELIDKKPNSPLGNGAI